jgi:preprotein translocase subunit SecA
MLQRLGMEEGVPIESKMITRRIEGAQKAVETQNFEARKHILEYDDVMNKQREAVYGLRRQLLEGLDEKGLIVDDYVATILSDALLEFAPDNVHTDQWNAKGLRDKILGQFGMDIQAEGIDPTTLNRHELGEEIFDKLKARYDAKEQILGAEQMRYHERMMMLSVLDAQWKDHLLNMDHLKEGIQLRGYGQHDPLVEYKRESFDLFEAMMARFQQEAVRYLFLLQIIGPDGQPLQASGTAALPPPAPRSAPAQLTFSGPTSTLDAGARSNGAVRPPNGAAPPPPNRNVSTTIDRIEAEFQRKKERELQVARMAGGSEPGTTPQHRSGEKVGRNEPCPCGSGKKYKKCHGAEA